MEIKYDFLGQEVNVGDSVIFIEVNYGNFMKGKVKTLSPQLAIIDTSSNGSRQETRQRYNQIINLTAFIKLEEKGFMYDSLG